LEKDMASMTLLLPDDLLTTLSSSGTDPAEVLRRAAAFSLCSRGVLTTSQAARLAGLSYAQFLEASAQAKVDLFQFTTRELEEELALSLPSDVIMG
jgi:predicted HTH domain antitoxin